jgi:murein DD-endopeptidase MepM/ murein hydrolase activator NlpD
MAIRTFVTPKADSGFLNIRSENRIDAANIVGALNEGVRLDFVGEVSGWYACRVFVSTLVANAADGCFVCLNAGGDFANIRLAPRTDLDTDVGDLKADQQLELIERLGDWLAAKVYVSAAWSDLITEGQPDVIVPVADGFDTPVGTPDERASAQVWPGAWIDATPYGTRYDATGKWAIHTGADLNLPADEDAHSPCYAPAAGVVRAAAQYPVWGNVITIEHQLADGTRLWSRLAHLDDILVQINQVVTRGQIVGHVGDAFGIYAYHLHYDLARLDLGASPSDWPGDDLPRVQRDYIDPLPFTIEHRPDRPRPATKLLIGLHDESGGAWLKQKKIKGVCLALATVQDQPVQLDFTDLSDAGLTVLLRIGYGYADGTGTLPRPNQLTQFEKAVADTLNAAKGVTASHYGNEINNASESPGWDPATGQAGPDYFPLTPDYYLASYNRLWFMVRADVKLGPAPLDPFFGPPFSFLAWSSDNREWWRAILRGIAGADALFLHSKTQSNQTTEIWSDVKFANDPLRWQYLHFRAIEPYLSEVPDKYKALPVYITEANPQRKINNALGWEASSAAWITECVNYLKTWNEGVGHQAINGAVFYRWADDEWQLASKSMLLNRVEGEAQKLGLVNP